MRLEAIAPNAPVALLRLPRAAKEAAGGKPELGLPDAVAAQTRRA
jgi:hypothetical protein